MWYVFPWRCFPFADSTPRAYRLKVSNAAPLFSTSAGTFRMNCHEPHLQILRRHSRSLLLQLEHAHRSALENHVHCSPRLGNRRSPIVRIGITCDRGLGAIVEPPPSQCRARRRSRRGGVLHGPSQSPSAQPCSPALLERIHLYGSWTWSP